MGDGPSGRRRRISRRRFAALTMATGASALAGCSNSDGDGGDGTGADDGDGSDDGGGTASDDAPLEIDAPGEAELNDVVTVTVTRDGDPVAGATVTVDDDPAGATDSTGTVSFEYPHVGGSVLVSASEGGERATTLVEGTGVVDPVIDHWFVTLSATPQDEPIRYNPFAPGPDAVDRFGVFAQWTQYLVGADEFHPHLIEDWEHGDGELVLRLSEAFVWGRGGSITADDLRLQLEVYTAAEAPATRFVEGVEATGEFELTVSYPADTNHSLVEYTLLAILADVPPSNWTDAGWEDDPASVEVRDLDPSGPLAVDEWTENVHRLVPRTGHPAAADHPRGSHYNWRGYTVEHRGATRDEQAASFIAGEIDGTNVTHVLRDYLEQFPETTREIRIPGATGPAIWFDHASEPWDERPARQALAHAIDRSAVTQVVDWTIASHHPVPTGLSEPVRDRWLGSETPEGFTQYERDVARSEALLSEVGRTPGEMTVDLAVPSAPSHWSMAASAIAQQLEAAGWTVETSTPDSTEAGFEGDASPDLRLGAYAPSNATRSYYPYFPLEYVFGRPVGDPDRHFAGYDPGTVDVGDTSVNVEAELAALASDRDRAAHATSVERLARVVNEDLPCLPLFETVEQSFIDRDAFVFEDEDGSYGKHLQSRWPLWWLPKVDELLPGASSPGLLKARR